MSRLAHIIFLAVWLLFSAWGVYWLWSFYQKTSYGKKIEGRSWNCAAEVGEDFNKQFLQNLTQEKHPLLKQYGELKADILGQALTPKVQIGKEGWLFLADEDKGRNTLHQSLGYQQYSADILRRWSLLFKQRYEWCQKRNIDYFLIFAPNKATVYPEYLPERFKVTGESSRLALKQKLPDVPILDLSDSLVHYKSLGQLYYRHDTHWNDLGAWIAYRSTIHFLQTYYPNIGATASLDACLKQSAPQIGGDLARLILQEEERVEESPKLSPPINWANFDESRNAKISPNVIEQLYRQPNASFGKVIFDHDSFFQPLGPYLAGHFQESIFLWGWQAFAAAYIEKQQPIFVVDEWVERSFTGSMPRNYWWMIQEYWQQHWKELNPSVEAEVSLSKLALWREEAAKDDFALIALDFQLEEEDKLVIQYTKKKGYYPLSKGETRYYLQWPKEEIKGVWLESGKELLVNCSLAYLTYEKS